MEVPLPQWCVSNFKSIEDASIAFAPLNVVVGANSSGKSSLLQSILLAVQTAQSNSTGDRLDLNGPLVSLGSYSDVLRAGGRGPISIGGTHVPRERDDMRYSRPRGPRPIPVGVLRTSAINWRLGFRGGPPNELGASLISSVAISMMVAEEDAEGGTLAQLSVRRTAARKGIPPRAVYVFSRGFRGGIEPYDPFVGSVRLGTHKPVRTYNLRLASGLPVGFMVARDANAVNVGEWLDWLASGADAVRQRRLFNQTRGGVDRPVGHFQSVTDEDLFTGLINGALALVRRLADIPESRAELEADPDLRRRLFQIYRECWEETLLPYPRQRRRVQEMVPAVLRAVKREVGAGEKVLVEAEEHAPLIEHASTRLRQFLARDVHYLGPLRQDPQAVYLPGQSTSAGFLGTKGEYTASVLHTLGSTVVGCPRQDGRLVPMSLSEAVSFWLRKLEVGEGLDTRSLGRPGIELSLRETRAAKAQNLANVGVGISQLVPVVVRCLLAPPGSLVLLEQPELHLHPGLQQRLGDFLLAMARGGRQLIVETHSDHIVARLRLHIAKDASDETMNAVAIIHAWRDRDGTTRYENVRHNRYGGIDDWPPGFFDQTATEAQEILRAAIAKRSRDHVGEESG